MIRFCFLNIHKWDRCICEKCGKVRPASFPGHDWDGCICRKCRVKRYVPAGEHDWDGCFCRKCGVEAPENMHDWELIDQKSSESESDEWYGGHFVSMTSVTETNVYRCRRCGKERSETRTVTT